MANSKIKIRYDGTSPGAKENFVPTFSEKEWFVKAEDLQVSSIQYKNFINLCELNTMVLNGNGQPFPDAPENENMGFWSVQTSGLDGRFETPIEISYSAAKQYSSAGLTLTFDYNNNIFANNINIKWYRGEELLSDVNFAPDKAIYFCKNKVLYYTKVVITIYALNMPFVRLKFRGVDYGFIKDFMGDELRTVNIIQETDPISISLPISTLDFVLDSKSDIDYDFQEKQPLRLYWDETLIMITFITSAVRQSKHLWKIQSEDYIGLMDNEIYRGKVCVPRISVITVLGEIFEAAKVPWSPNLVDSTIADLKVVGYIPYGTCREALKQVLFATQTAVETLYSEDVGINILDNEICATIPLTQVMVGQNVMSESRITGVELSEYASRTILLKQEVYSSSDRQTNVLVKFNAPMYSIRITNGEIIEPVIDPEISGVLHSTYIIVNAEPNCIVTASPGDIGQETVHRKVTPLMLENENEHIVTISGGTLVWKHQPSGFEDMIGNPDLGNVDKLLEKCYNYFVDSDTMNAKIVVSNPFDIPLGKVISVETPYSGNFIGRVIKQTYNLNGNKVVKDCVIKRYKME